MQPKWWIQFSVQGFLFLIGAGGLFVPTVTTWTPSIIIWSIAFVWGVITFILWRKSIGASASIQQAHVAPLEQEGLWESQLSDNDKTKISSLMETANTLVDSMNRFLDESIYFEGNKERHFQSLLDTSEFREMWDRCSSQRAIVSVLSPKLSEAVRDLLEFMRHFHGYFLQERPESYSFKVEVEGLRSKVEILRKRVQNAQEELIYGHKRGSL